MSATAGIMTHDDEAEVTHRLMASIFLGGSGWRVDVTVEREFGVAYELFHAFHAHYPSQRAKTVTELVKRCVWQEDNRTRRRN